MENQGKISDDNSEQKKRPQEILVENIDENNVEKIRLVNAEKLEKIKAFDFNNPELDYSQEDREKIIRLREKFQEMVLLAGDDSNNFLEAIKNLGVGVVNESQFLKKRTQTLDNFITRAAGRSTGMNAAYVPPEMVEVFIKEETDNGIRDELISAQRKNGLILLYKNPNPKSIFHEGVHALQYVDSFEMDPKNAEQHSKREIEVSWSIITTKDIGLLKEVSRLEPKKTIGGPFGKIPIYGSNDVEKEIVPFFSNLDTVKKCVRLKKNLN